MNNLDRKIDELELSIRVMSGLKTSGIDTIGDLIKLTEGEFLRTPNFGIKSLNEVREVLSGMSLKMTGVKTNGKEEKTPSFFKEYNMKNFDDGEIEFILNCCTSNLKLTIGNLHNSSGRNSKYVMSKLDNVMYQHELLKKLHSIVGENKKKNKLSLTGISTTPLEDTTPENIDVISDDELKKRIVNGTLVDDKLETTLFPNGRPDK